MHLLHGRDALSSRRPAGCGSQQRHGANAKIRRAGAPAAAASQAAADAADAGTADAAASWHFVVNAYRPRLTGPAAGAQTVRDRRQCTDCARRQRQRRLVAAAAAETAHVPLGFKGVGRCDGDGHIVP